MTVKQLTLPLTEKEIEELHAGDTVLLSGTILTARDCAHKRIFEYLDQGKELPFPIKDSVVYYAGPCPAKPNAASGSCGPTTSARMNVFAPRLYDLGLNCAIGKGEMSDEVKQAIVRNRRCYFAAIGGAGALYEKSIVESKCIAFPDLLSEAVHQLKIVDFPAVVATDCRGNTIY